MKRRTENIHAACSLLLLLFLVSFQARAGSVLDSPHNLAVSGTGSIRAASQTDVCIFCHTPHGGNSQMPLWNHSASTASYVVYSSTTMIATVGQPNGSSVLCLSCHDGTVALGMLNSCSKPVKMQGDVTVMPAGSTNLGTDLSQDHPISFTYNSALATKEGELADPSTLTGKVKLDRNSQMQCTSCHDPHNNQFGNFLVMDNAGSALCVTCHTDPLWTDSAHHLSNLPLPAAASKLLAQGGAPTRSAPGAASTSKLLARSGAKTVGANACDNCHTPHAAAGRQQLLLTAVEYQTCYVCHNGSVVRQNIEAEFNKPSVHPLLQSSKLANPGQNIISGTRKVTCSDCHDPHAAKKVTAATASTRVSGAILGVEGVTRTGALVNSVTYEYELCFRCHRENGVRAQATVNRITPQPDTRLAFSTSNSSYHPVVAIGKNPRVPSLVAPYTPGTLIKCTDCHNNDQGPGAGGAGPNGPHGSAFAPLLERQLITVDYMGESIQNYALCYKCHDRNSILSDQSFRAINSLGQDCGHRFHIVDQKTACTTCHDSHGVANNKHLINFNPIYVTRASNGQIAYNSTGLFRGNCTLTCHGFNHVDTAYPNALIAHAATSVKTLKRKR